MSSVLSYGSGARVKLESRKGLKAFAIDGRMSPVVLILFWVSGPDRSREGELGPVESPTQGRCKP